MDPNPRWAAMLAEQLDEYEADGRQLMGDIADNTT
jgi:hypothetical protein